MGEVYCARDTRLNRDVAIMFLPDLFAADSERLARFEREAQLLASLNHSRIAQIYGFEDSLPAGSGQPAGRALVMELVDGPTLAGVRHRYRRSSRERERAAADAPFSDSTLSLRDSRAGIRTRRYPIH
jgi:serine/threonine protein kinase